MALRLVCDFDLRKDVLPGLRARRAASLASGARGGGPGILEDNYESLRILNVERNGNIIYTYKDDKGNVAFGLYDCRTRQNEHLYTFEKDLHVISCSINSERTLLAASLVHSAKEGRKNELQPVQCLQDPSKLSLLFLLSLLSVISTSCLDLPYPTAMPSQAPLTSGFSNF